MRLFKLIWRFEMSVYYYYYYLLMAGKYGHCVIMNILYSSTYVLVIGLLHLLASDALVNCSCQFWQMSVFSVAQLFRFCLKYLCQITLCYITILCRFLFIGISGSSISEKLRMTFHEISSWSSRWDRNNWLDVGVICSWNFSVFNIVK